MRPVSGLQAKILRESDVTVHRLQGVVRLMAATVLAHGIAISAARAQDDQSTLYPLPEIEGALSWQALGQLEIRVEDARTSVVVPANIEALVGETVKAVGFLLPLDAEGTRQLLMSVSPHCPFCVPVGREGVIELSSDTPIGSFLRAVVVEGQFDIVDDGIGALYRMSKVELLDQ